ncbi:SseB family protein [Microbacterium ulmi]|uniref:SseB family protein n=1 Tax=Microbacterium ulmi TaxID=179095 RepID=A0A7Y2Q1N5_9MICO|nr:SseB family protein [Microbacterium ulmi]NII70227.1 hypothetical protein [Microbacterium ulmi]NNH04512.1 SseB family protein [Microbacterium ulmi]
MAIFKRRRDASPDAPTAEPTEPVAAPDEEIAAPDTTAAAASVGISVSSFGGFGSSGAPDGSPPAEQTARPITNLGPELAPPATETVPGLRDNVLLREALAALPDEPTNQQLAGVARHLLQGHVFLRVRGDARALLSEGKELPLAIGTKDDQHYVFVYSSGAALNASVQHDGATDTSAMGQPVLTVLRYVLAGPYAGIMVDPASGSARAVYTRALIERMVAEADPELEIKTILSEERTPETAARVADALTRARFWLAANTAPGGGFGIAEARSPEGERLIELYSHPIEIVAMGRGDQPAPMTAAQLAAALRSDEGIAGVIVDAAGPWIRLTRDDLAPVLNAE